jgi:hypothetical protein
VRECRGTASLFGASAFFAAIIGLRVSEVFYMLVNEWDTVVRTVLRSQSVPRTSSSSRSWALGAAPISIAMKSLRRAAAAARSFLPGRNPQRGEGGRGECPVTPRRDALRLVVPIFQGSGV